MNTGESKNGEPIETEDLANDVARLYSLAHVEDVPYYSFSRHRRTQSNVAQLTEVIENTSPAKAVDAPLHTTEQSAMPVATEVPHSEGSNAVPQIQSESSVVLPRTAISVEQEREHTAATQSSTAPTKEACPVAPFALETIPGGEVSTAMAVFSLAGGVGKTTITANLGRILCSLGEQVLLVDASGSGLLPFYFGATDLKPGLRTFMAPKAGYPPMHVVGTEEVTSQWLQNEVMPATRTVQRTIFDLGPASMALLPEILPRCAIMLVPLLSDLNSILTVSRIEKLVAGMQLRESNVPSPFYVFNKFDAQSPMDNQARNLVLRQCGDRLLPHTIRRSGDVSAAISERMTVADHCPDSDVTTDFFAVATWLQKVAPARSAVRSARRWSER
jgi:cellulose biosynthesis protein BcsQ